MSLVRLHLFLYRILQFFILFYPGLIAVIRPAVKHQATCPHSTAAHSSPRDNKPHKAALLRPHYAVFCNFFFMQLAGHSTSTGPADKKLFIPKITPTWMIWAILHMTSQSHFFLFFIHSTRSQRHSMHHKSYLSGFHTIPATVQRMIRAASLM